ncbi:hypothetical protein EUGRSUZ_I01857 [Eucalyptus grandis]|uniref:Uncharacterized protein n=2 Tax=Eucalyptus grandis TaxID=71139 RepID=A0A059AQI2_EUCGR|nr:hypothetical protein EUGRSUZ_I01857 [Eucalyptus grandis]
MRERGGATKLKASLARSNAHLGDSEWSAEAPLEIGGVLHELVSQVRNEPCLQSRATSACLLLAKLLELDNKHSSIVKRLLIRPTTTYIGAIAKPSRIKASSPYSSNSKRPTYSLFPFFSHNLFYILVCYFYCSVRLRSPGGKQ